MRRFEVQFQRFLQVGQCLFLGLALAGDIEFQALRDVPLPFTPYGRGEWSLHDLIVSQVKVRPPGTQLDNLDPVASGGSGGQFAGKEASSGEFVGNYRA